MSKPFFAKVKSVLSGDTLVLTPPNNNKNEKIFSLAYVNAPRLSKEGEEPFAFQSREYLRELLVGKTIQCTVAYTVPSGREFGSALLSQTGPSIPDEAIKAGWLKIREEAGRKDDNEDTIQRIENLRNLETEAKNAGKGLWSGKGGDVKVVNDLNSDMSILKEYQGKVVDGVVERVISGDRLLVRVLLSDKKHLQTMTLLAGIRAPSTERTIQGQTHPAEEFSNEAKAFVEERLLQRRVKVDIVGPSSSGQLVAALIHPNGNKNIAEFLLQEGLAHCTDTHSTLLGEKMAALRAAEKSAQSKKLRLHKNHVAKAEGSKSDMTVTKIIGADTILVSNKAGSEQRINFSSVRGPRAGEPSEAPYRDEAKEFLRKKLIGKRVHVSIDGSKPASDGFEARDVATVTEKGKNIGLVLVQEGYASVIRHRREDTDRAPNYDDLLAAQEQAKEEKKGIWSGKAPKLKQFVDVSESVQKAKIQLGTLQRQKKVPAVVDFVKSGSRFTVLIPREGVKLTLVLGGIRAPRAPGRGESGEAFGQEALDFANRRLNQRDVEIDVQEIDKNGGFIGALYTNRESFAKLLVEEGLAQVHHFSAEKSGNANELYAAEKKAKEGRKGQWHSWDPSQDEEDEAEVVETAPETTEAYDSKPKPKDYREVVITNIDGNGKIKIQEIGKGTAALTTLMNDFKKFHIDSKNSKPISDSPKAGDFVAAKFSADGQWYRARIRSNDRQAKVAEVVYIDYGNTEKQPWSKLRPLDQPQFTVQKLKAQAIDASLSFLQLPTAPEYFQESIDFIAELTEGKELVASVDYVDSKENLSYITLFDSTGGKKPGPHDSINKEIVANGQAMVPKKLKAWERSVHHADYLKHLKDVESQAKQDRLGMWEYGDITED